MSVKTKFSLTLDALALANLLHDLATDSVIWAYRRAMLTKAGFEIEELHPDRLFDLILRMGLSFPRAESLMNTLEELGCALADACADVGANPSDEEYGRGVPRRIITRWIVALDYAVSVQGDADGDAKAKRAIANLEAAIEDEDDEVWSDLADPLSEGDDEDDNEQSLAE